MTSPTAPPLARLAPALLLAALAACGCTNGAADPAAPSTPAAGPAEFDAARAWKHLEEQVAVGPRASGSGALERLRVTMTAHLERLGHTVVREAFTEQTPIGPIDYVNLVVDVPPTAKDGDPSRLVILGTHYDTKRGLPFEFVGANDGASGTAVFLELARVLAHGGGPERDYTLRLLFLDGEEAIGDWNPFTKNNTYGSRHHARRLKDAGTAKDVRACVILDMVGDAGLQLARDTNSERTLLKLAFDTARELGLGAHVEGVRKEILDDHVSFREVGIPSIDLIDAEYGPVTPGANMGAFWHTAQDVPANCSRESLDVIGRITLGLLPKLNRP